jgi:hypothetical protein
MLEVLDFSCCCGFMVVRKKIEDYEEGEFVLFYFEDRQTQVEELASCIKGFDTMIVHYPLSSHIVAYGTPQNLIRKVFS